MSGLEKLGLLGRFSAALQRIVLKRTLVGLDEYGNRYWRCAPAANVNQLGTRRLEGEPMHAGGWTTSQMEAIP